MGVSPPVAEDEVTRRVDLRQLVTQPLAQTAVWIVGDGGERLARLFGELTRRGARCDVVSPTAFRIPRFEPGVVDVVLVVNEGAPRAAPGLLRRLSNDPLARWATVLTTSWDAIEAFGVGSTRTTPLVEAIVDATWSRRRLYDELVSGRRDGTTLELLGPLTCLAAFASRPSRTRVFYEGSAGRAQVEVLSGHLVEAILHQPGLGTRRGLDALAAVALWRDGVVHAREEMYADAPSTFESLASVFARTLQRTVDLDHTPAELRANPHHDWTAPLVFTGPSHRSEAAACRDEPTRVHRRGRTEPPGAEAHTPRGRPILELCFDDEDDEPTAVHGTRPAFSSTPAAGPRIARRARPARPVSPRDGSEARPSPPSRPRPDRPAPIQPPPGRPRADQPRAGQPRPSGPPPIQPPTRRRRFLTGPRLLLACLLLAVAAGIAVARWPVTPYYTASPLPEEVTVPLTTVAAAPPERDGPSFGRSEEDADRSREGSPPTGSPRSQETDPPAP